MYYLLLAKKHYVLDVEAKNVHYLHDLYSRVVRTY